MKLYKTRETAAFGSVSLALPSAERNKKKIGAPKVPPMVLRLPQGHEDSEYVLNFYIGQREGGFYSARTESQTHPIPY